MQVSVNAVAMPDADLIVEWMGRKAIVMLSYKGSTPPPPWATFLFDNFATVEGRRFKLIPETNYFDNATRKHEWSCRMTGPFPFTREEWESLVAADAKTRSKGTLEA